MRKNKSFMLNMFDNIGPMTFAQSQNDVFYSTDTEAFLNFSVNRPDFEFDSAKVALVNLDDGSVISHDAEVDEWSKTAEYEIPEEVIAHWGRWRAQATFVSGEETFAGAVVEFVVERHLTDDRPERLIAVRDWDVLKQEATDLIASIQQSETEWEQAELDRQVQEEARETAEGEREEAESTRETNEQTRINKDLLRDDKIAQMEADKDAVIANATVDSEVILARGGKATLGQRLDETTAQLAQTESEATKGNSNYYIPSDVDSYDGNGASGINSETIKVSELYALWDSLIAEFPDSLTKTLLGKDQSETYDIFKINMKPLKPKHKMLVAANIHGNGTYGDPNDASLVLYEFIKDILTNNDSNKAVQFLKYNTEIEFIPCANPWGYDNKTRENSRNVDLNRNFDYKWAGVGSGTHPASEKETQIVSEWLLSNSDAIGFVDLHAYGVSNKEWLFAGITCAKDDHETFILNEVGHYLSDKYGTHLMTDDNLAGGMTRTFSHVVAKIPAITIEFPVYSAPTIGEITHGKEMTKRYLEWLGNYIFRICSTTEKEDELILQQGDWTPVFAGTTSRGENTYSHQQGSYYRIGNLVHVDFEVGLSALDSNMIGSIYIAGLPFKAKDGSMSTNGTVGRFTGFSLSDGVNDVSIFINPGSTYISIREVANKVDWSIKDWNMTSSTRMYGSITYIV